MLPFVRTIRELEACRDLGKAASSQSPAQALSARISLANCLADQKMRDVALCDCEQSIKDIEAASEQSFALLDWYKVPLSLTAQVWLFFALFAAFPLFWLVASSLKTPQEITKLPPVWLPSNPGGPSHHLLKQLFIDKQPDTERYPALAHHFRPDDWKPYTQSYPPFHARDRFDAFWAASILIRFTRAQLTGSETGAHGDEAPLPDFYATYAEGHDKPMAIIETAFSLVSEPSTDRIFALGKP